MIQRVYTLDRIGSHLLPEGGTEHTSTAPASSGYVVFMSIVTPTQQKNNVRARFYYKTNKPIEVGTTDKIFIQSQCRSMRLEEKKKYPKIVYF